MAEHFSVHLKRSLRVCASNTASSLGRSGKAYMGLYTGLAVLLALCSCASSADSQTANSQDPSTAAQHTADVELRMLCNYTGKSTQLSLHNVHFRFIRGPSQLPFSNFWKLNDVVRMLQATVHPASRPTPAMP